MSYIRLWLSNEEVIRGDWIQQKKRGEKVEATLAKDLRSGMRTERGWRHRRAFFFFFFFFVGDGNN